MDDVTAFVMQRSYYEAAADFPPEAKLAYLDGLIRYALYGEAPQDLDATGAAVFTAIKPAVDASIERYQRAKAAGAKGGRPKGSGKPLPKAFKSKA